MLQAEGLRKSYGERVAVGGLSLQARAGEILGLLGPNGAGKSTTVGMLCGLIAPDAGKVLLGGERLHGQRSPLKRRIATARPARPPAAWTGSASAWAWPSS